jgi:hypothetical protein
VQRLIFEYNPFWILACVAIGLLYAWLLYQKKSTWSVTENRLLFIGRAVVVAILGFLLIGPILKLTSNETEKPSLVFLIDNSTSVKEVLDSASRMSLLESLKAQQDRLEAGGYAVEVRGLDGSQQISFNQPTSDLQQGLKRVAADYEGKNLASIILVSDGIYNSGVSPLYLSLRTPVYTVGIGDTTDRVDLALKNTAYNKIAYQGNKFPLHVEVLVKGTSSEEVKVSIHQAGKLIASESKNSGSRSLVAFDFLVDANLTGLQRYDLTVNSLPRETNTKNNRSAIFIEVVEGKKKILLASPSPHPDIKALRSAIEKNSNYEVVLHIPGVTEAELAQRIPEKTDLAIFLQALDSEGKNTSLIQQFLKSRTGLLLVLGGRSNLRQLDANGLPLVFENVTQKDDVTPVINTGFRDFIFSENLAGTLAGYPPVLVPFGKFTFPAEAQVLLYQKIGSVTTNRPLLFTWQDADRKMGALLGEGIWRWRLNEYSETEKTEHFDEVFSKLVQYLSTQDDKRKFRSFPLQNEFTDAEAVIFESQVYNDLFEPIYGNTIQLELRDDAGTTLPFSYTTSPSESRFRVGVLKEGVYRYRASTELNGKQEEVRGEFLVATQNLEAQNLTADFGLLRKVATNTNGRFQVASQVSLFGDELLRTEAKSVIHSEDSFHPVINL